jgi:hypothetical protein
MKVSMEAKLHTILTSPTDGAVALYRPTYECLPSLIGTAQSASSVTSKGLDDQGSTPDKGRESALRRHVQNGCDVPPLQSQWVTDALPLL